MKPERKRVACKTLYLVDIRNKSDGGNSRRPEKRKRYNYRLDMIHIPAILGRAK